MPGKYTYSSKAETDIKNIYINGAQKWGIAQADKYDQSLESCIQQIADMPDIGRKCDEIRKDYQRHEHESHIIFYKKRKGDILIVRVLHRRMDVNTNL